MVPSFPSESAPMIPFTPRPPDIPSEAEALALALREFARTPEGERLRRQGQRLFANLLLALEHLGNEVEAVLDHYPTGPMSSRENSDLDFTDLVQECHGLAWMVSTVSAVLHGLAPAEVEDMVERERAD